MTPIEGIVLGLVQGLTEFLPVSSSGHLVVFQTFFDVRGPSVAFDAAVHGATLLAIVVHFRRRLVSLVTDQDLAYVGKLALATLPIAIVGGLWSHAVEAAFRTPWIVPFALAATGTYLLSLYLRRDPGETSLEPTGRAAPTWVGALLIGLAQTVALLPGVSRSGSTIVTALWLGLAAPAAAEFSFLLGIPAILGAVGLQVDEMVHAADGGGGTALALGALVAFGSGLAAITLVFRLLARRGFRRFGFYCWAVALGFAAYLAWAA